MTVNELMARLEEFDGDMEVHVAVQPSWPLQCEIQDVVENNDCEESPVVYIAASDGVDYAPRSVYEGH